MKNYYNILGLPIFAATEEVEKKLVTIEPGDLERYQAYRVLADPAQCAVYDKTLATWVFSGAKCIAENPEVQPLNRYVEAISIMAAYAPKFTEEQTYYRLALCEQVGDIYVNQESYKPAITFFLKASQIIQSQLLQGSVKNYWFKLAEIYQKLGDAYSALRNWRASYASYNNALCSLSQKNNLDESEASFKNVLKENIELIAIMQALANDPPIQSVMASTPSAGGSSLARPTLSLLGASAEKIVPVAAVSVMPASSAVLVTQGFYAEKKRGDADASPVANEDKRDCFTM